MKKKVLAWMLSVFMVLTMMPLPAFANEAVTTDAGTAVAKVGSTEYATIDEAIANWTNGTTLTLLDDVTLSDVYQFKSTESRTLDLGTHTMTAASGKHAIEIQCNGQVSATYGLTVKADATNPGGITAEGKSCIYYRKSGTTQDRVIIRIDGGVFNGSYAVNVYSSNRGTNCPQVSINGGIFNGNINIGHGKLIASGGTFNGWVNCTGDSTAYRQISGGTYKSWQFMTADASNKFWVGTSKDNYNVGCYVDDNGYLVVGGPVITEAGDTFEASSTYYGGWSSYLQYSSAKDNGLYYTSVEEALADNNKTSGKVTVYVEEIDMSAYSSYKGTIIAPEGKTLRITNAPKGLTVEGEVVLVKPVAQIGNQGYLTLQAAIEAAQAGDVVEIIADEITFGENTASIVVDKAITIKGAGKEKTKLTFDSASSAFVVKSSNVTFQDMTIVQGTKDNSFHISIDKGAWNAPAIQYSDITIKSVDFVGGDYALCLIGEDVVVDDCTFTDQDSHNIIVYSLKGDSKIINNTFNASKGNNKSAILWEGGADNATDLSNFIGGGTLTIENNTANGKGVFFQFTNWKLVKDMSVTITDNIVDAFTNKAIALYDMDGVVTAEGDEFASFEVNKNVFTNVPEGRPIVKEYTGTVEVDASGNYLGSETPDYKALLVGDKVTVGGYYSDEALESYVDLSVAQIGEQGYLTLQAAIDAANEGDTVKVIEDVELTETLTIPAGKTVTLDLNGKAITTDIDETITKSFAMIQNKGNLTVTDSGEDGKISLSYTGESFGYGMGLYVISNEGGTVTVKDGTVENLATVSGSMYDAIDNNSTLGETVLNIEGGKVSCAYIAVRQFANSTSQNNIVNATGGTVDGGNCSIWTQNPNNNANMAKVEVSDGVFTGRILMGESSNFAGSITGGKFTEAAVNGTNEALIAEGMVFSETVDADGYYTVKKGLKPDPDSANTYLIRNLVELKSFRDDVNSGNTYSGKTVKLAADIDLASEEWTPIGNSTTSFQGTFDGDNHTISNLVVNGVGKSNQGLFGMTTNGEIKNLTVENAKVTGRLNVGVIAGTPYTSKYTNINVTGHVEVNGMSYVGGVGGKNAYANWTDITVNVDETSYVKATSTENGTAYRTYVGGVIGFMGEGGHTFKNISSNIDVIGDVCDIGGITGIAHYGNNFENIACSGDVTNTNTNAEDATETGGIAGVWNNTKGYTVTFENVSFTGNVEAEGVASNAKYGAAYNAGNTNSENSGQLVEDGNVIGPVYVAEISGLLSKKSFGDLQDAINTADNGDTIKMIADIATEDQIKVAAGKEITLDLNGKVVSRNTEDAVSSAAITNNGNLTIVDSSEDQTGKITAFAANPDTAGIPYYASNTITNCGVLTVKGGTIENSTGDEARAAFPIDNNSSSRDAIVNIEGGTIIGRGAIRQFANSTTSANEVNITGGTVSGTSYGIWVQNPGSNDPLAELNISGNADVAKVLLSPSTKFDVSISGGKIAEVAIWNADTTNAERNPSGFISGGTFNKPVDVAYCAEGYIPCENADGTYGVVEGKYVAEVDGEYYATLQDALDAAEPDAKTVTLLVNHEENSTMVPAGVTLDLNGFALDARYFVSFGQTVDNSDANTGVLAADNIMMQKDNEQLPIKNAEGGYQFFEVTKIQARINPDTGAYEFLPTYEAAAHALLIEGTANSGVSTCVRVEWTSGETTKSQDFTYLDDIVNNVINSYNGSNYERAFSLSITDADSYENLSYQVMLKSDIGVVKSNVIIVVE